MTLVKGPVGEGAGKVAIETSPTKTSVFIVAVPPLCHSSRIWILCDKADWLGPQALHLCQERSFCIREDDMDAHRLLREWESAMALGYSFGGSG